MSGHHVQNALAQETSPYLLQHADNPVDWYAWGPAALAKARREDKPILLSVGYSACHWCHVMAHESFEDVETARLMNEHFVNIKVDREERPDLDKIYQTAHQLLTRRPGGWPLTMFLNPENQSPFFGGTYFPKEPRHGMPAFKDILIRVSQFHHESRDAIREHNASLAQTLDKLIPDRVSDATPLTSAPLDAARLQLQHAFDRKHGGFGEAPKFPMPTNLDRLFRHYAATAAAGEPDDTALTMAAFTLRRMALGGMYDQVGGGFCRYSVDRYWMIPHFEKMLYDNGPLLALCAEAFQITGDPLFRRVALETAEWTMREMQSPKGGYYSTLDADSEGEEGKFYLWTPEEVQRLLTDDEYRVVAKGFGLDRAPNFEGTAWNLHVYSQGKELAHTLGLDPKSVDRLLDSARGKLFAARERRVRPGRDEKVLTSWNALMIRGMSVAGRLLEEDRLVQSAERALDFIADSLWLERRLLATYKDGRANLGAYLDDYAFLIDAILNLLQARWRDRDLDFAIQLAEVLLDKFQDREKGGFFFTADDHEALIHRPKPLADDALPAGNGVAAQALGRLGHLLGEPRYLKAAEQTLRAAWPALSEFPHAHTALLLALEETVYPPEIVVLRGDTAALHAWRRRCSRRYAPRRLTISVPGDASLPGVLAARQPRGEAVAYVCRGSQCSAPVTDLERLDAMLSETELRPP